MSEIRNDAKKSLACHVVLSVLFLLISVFFPSVWMIFIPMSLMFLFGAWKIKGYLSLGDDELELVGENKNNSTSHDKFKDINDWSFYYRDNHY